MTTPTVNNAKDSAEFHARQAANSPWLDRAARLGFLAKGLVYALIGVLAFAIAMGDQQRADQKGALQAIAAKPGGSVVLWLMVLGFVAYAGWRFSEAAFGRRDETDEKKRTAKRFGSAANGAIYLAFAVLAFRTVTSSSSSGGGGADITAKVLAWPGGQAIIVVAGLVIIVVAVALAWRGLKTDFEKHLDTGRMSRTTFTAVRRLGQVGYIARGAVFFLIGALVVKAAVDHQPGKAQGFDVALRSLAGAPFGQVLLIAAAIGLICFGAYCVAEARYRRL
jgi:flagellar basal body-associated protein FliL